MKMSLVKYKNFTDLVAQQPMDLLFVGSMNEYKDNATEFLSSKGFQIKNISSAYVDLYPNNDPISCPEGCYHADKTIDEKMYFYGNRIDPTHHLLMFFRKIKYGREFGAVCSALTDPFFNRVFNPKKSPYNYAIVRKWQNQYDEVIDHPGFSDVLVPVSRDETGFLLHFEKRIQL